MQWIVNTLEKTSGRKGLITLGISSVLIFGLIWALIIKLMTLTGGTGILDFEIGYTPEKVQAVLGSYGAEGMALYRRIQWLDLVNPAIYGLLMASILYRLYPTQKSWSWLVLLPLLAALLDYAENGVLFILATDFPDISAQWVTLGSMISLLKNAVLFLAIMALLVGGWRWYRR